jgi:hypothetical protein
MGFLDFLNPIMDKTKISVPNTLHGEYHIQRIDWIYFMLKKAVFRQIQNVNLVKIFYQLEKMTLINYEKNIFMKKSEKLSQILTEFDQFLNDFLLLLV